MTQDTKQDKEDWHTDNSYVIGVRGYENVKGTKYAKKIINDKTETWGDLKDGVLESLSGAKFGAKYLKEIFKLMKSSKAETVEIRTGSEDKDDFTAYKPLYVTFYGEDGEERGEVILAPRVDEI